MRKMSLKMSPILMGTSLLFSITGVGLGLWSVQLSTATIERENARHFVRGATVARILALEGGLDTTPENINTVIGQQHFTSNELLIGTLLDPEMLARHGIIVETSQ